jgi:FKBP-type peptidyl-prolyl cis-trans isomerase FkpA
MKPVRLSAVALAAALAAAACSKGASSSGPVQLTNDDQKIVYSLGLSIARSVKIFSLNEEEQRLLHAGLSDGLSKDATPQVKLEEWGPKINDFQRKRQGAVAEGEKAKGAAYAEKAAAESGAEKLASGLVYKELKAGEGAQPTAADRVQVHYRGTLIDGTEFDSSFKRNEPATFPLGGVIPCWTEGVQKMKEGGKARLVCPAAIAYGDRGSPPTIPGGATLVFEVELLKVEKAAQ